METSRDFKEVRKTKIKQTEKQEVVNACECKVYKMNQIVEITACEKKSHVLEKYKKISKENYMEVSTGEVFDYKVSENRADNLDSLRKTFAGMRRLINANFTGAFNEKHITLTYRENMTDSEKLYKDFERYWKRFLWKYGKAEYIAVVEPQERGAWHLHVLVKLIEHPDLFIRNNEELEPLWGNGFTTCKTISGVDNVGAYLTAYLSDIELDPAEAQKIVVGVKEVKGKKYVKGARLYMYPPGINLYRHSKGIIVPKPEQMTYEDIKKQIGEATPTYSKTVEILDDDGKTLNTITYEHYNMNRR